MSFAHRLAMPLLCPICKSPVVQELDRTGDAICLSCPEHGNFKVADTVFAEAKAKDYSREQWEAALDKAKERPIQVAEPGHELIYVIWPHIPIEPLLSGQILCLLLERERVELRDRWGFWRLN
jgi:hypothetical protein